MGGLEGTRSLGEIGNGEHAPVFMLLVISSLSKAMELLVASNCRRSQGSPRGSPDIPSM